MDDAQRVFDLHPLGIIQIAGGDAAEFLSAQLTGEVEVVKSGRHQLTSWCNPKGRILCLARLFCWDGDYYFLLPRSLIERTIQRLRMFVLRADVQLADVSDACHRYGATALTSAPLIDLPTPEPDRVSTSENIALLAIAGTAPANTRFIVVSRETLTDVATDGSYDDWRRLDIAAGLPSVEAQTAEMFLPQMLDLEALGGLSFQKGCFPGQEIIARLHYRGELKRRMYRGSAGAEHLPEPGDPVFAGSAEDNNVGNETVGNIVDAQWQADGEAALLVVIQIEKADAGDIRLQDPRGPRLALAEAI